MADVPNSPEFIQNEEIDFRSPLSESVLQKISGSINYLLDNVEKFAIGEIVSANLTESEFQSVTSTDWVLADGRSVIGSAYSILTLNSNIPDCRGLFTRGKNNGRSDGNQNPDGDLALGTYQADSLGSHSHAISRTHNLCSVDQRLVQGSGGGPTPAPGPTTLSVTLLNSGGAESNGRCITENIFIKIN